MTQDGVDRRTRFIMAVAVCVGIGVTISPGWATNNLWNVSETTPAGVRAIRSGAAYILFLIPSFLSLNTLLVLQ